jgi:cobalt/nickel transport system permease protein
MAHIPDGFLSAPVVVGTAATSAAALAVAAHRSQRRLAEREAPLLGALTAFVFAAQMLNFPLGAGTSAHLLGGVLVATLVGPWSGMLVLFAVILVQALLFQDGGIAALGANTLNMAVIGAGGGFLLYRWVLALLGGQPARRAVAAGLAAFGSTAMVGVAVALELAASGIVPLGRLSWSSAARTCWSGSVRPCSRGASSRWCCAADPTWLRPLGRRARRCGASPSSRSDWRSVSR